MTSTLRLAAATVSVSITAGLLHAVFAIAATAPDSQVVREAMASQQPSRIVVAQRAASAALPQFADASRFTR